MFADAGVGGPALRVGMQAYVLGTATCRLPAQCDFGVTGPDALHIRGAAGVVDEAGITEFAAVAELRALAQVKHYAAVVDGWLVCSICAGFAGAVCAGAGAGAGDRKQQDHGEKGGQAGVGHHGCVP